MYLYINIHGGGGERERERYFKELAHTVVEMQVQNLQGRPASKLEPQGRAAVKSKGSLLAEFLLDEGGHSLFS